ncbi:hypothetical protein M3Y97_00019600 [Aphelenchoides bicaudatus]|nr:hypothetical protein M3Y97_00019600 [Aphelenchoides bicaudatus]
MASTAQQLQRALEERAKEIEQLQNKVQRAELDRQKWEQQRRVLESKQPQDIQQLIRQKRELQEQLQREESEKQELFTEINKLIGEVAELQTKAENNDLSDTNQRLESQVQQLKHENGQLKSQFESKNQKFQVDLNEQKQEVGRLQKSHEHELNKLNGDLRKLQKELEVKDAAFQSLKLAKPSSKEDSLERELEKLKSEVVQKTQENAQLLTQKKELEQFKNQLTSELNQIKHQLEEQQERQQKTDKHQEELLGVFEVAAVPSTSGMTTLKRKILSMKNDTDEEITRRKKLETECDQLRQTLNSSNSARQELARRMDELRDENDRLLEKASVEEEIHNLMLSLKEAKVEVANKEAESTSWHQKAMKLEEQCDQLHSDLAHKQSALQKAEHELHELRSTAVDTEILAKLESELHEVREAIASKERFELESTKAQTELSDLKDQLASINVKLEESELKRQQQEQKRTEEVKRLREEHRFEIDRMRREHLDEKEKIQEKVELAEKDAARAQENATSTRHSVDEAQKRLAHVLNCPANFDLILATVSENEQKLRQLQQQVESGNTVRREQDARLEEEVNRLKDREATLELSLSTSKANEDSLKSQIRQLEQKESSANASTEDRLKLMESDIEELNKMNAELRETAIEEQRQHDIEIKNASF